MSSGRSAKPASTRRLDQNHLPPRRGGSIRLGHLGLLAVLLVLPGIAVGHRFAPEQAGWAAGWVLLASSVTYGLYAWDKHHAGRGGRRIPEYLLHLGELMGGWPGAFLAQRHLRHKSCKPSYRIIFWLIVAGYQFAAVDALRNWSWCRQVASAAVRPLHGK